MLARARADGLGVGDGDINSADGIAGEVAASEGLLVDISNFLLKSKLSSCLI